MPKVEMSIDERKDLTHKLIAELLVNPGRNKKEIKANLEEVDFIVTTSEINSVLYRNPRYFKHDYSTLPNWQVNDQYIGELLELLREETPAFGLSFYKGNEPRAWQLEAMGDWVRQGRRGVVEAVTGTGKTAVGILAAADAIARGRDVLVLVPGLELLQQWRDECEKNLTGDIFIGHYSGKQKDSFESHHLIIASVQSVRNAPLLPHENYGLLIADEVHRYGAEKSALALDESFDERLGLTATYERTDDGMEKKLSPYFSPLKGNGIESEEVIVGCGYARGLSDGILAPFRVATIGVDFDEEEEAAYCEYDERIRKAKTQLIYNFGCPAEPFGEFMKAVNKLSMGGTQDHIGPIIARNYLGVFNKRRDVLAASTKKMEALSMIVPLVRQSNRTLVFTNTIDSAAKAADVFRSMGISASNFDSDLPKEERKNLLEWFRKGKLQLLAAPKILDEGIDIPEADLGIILTASHSKRQMIQRMGRIIRPKKDGRVATFIIFYVRNTNEDPAYGIHETFLEEMSENAEEVRDFQGELAAADILKWFKN